VTHPEHPERADAATVDYFDAHDHHYSKQRIKGVASLLSHRVTRDSTLCDVGAGGGETLRGLAQELGLKRRNLTAMDVSRNSLARVTEKMPRVQTALVSVLDDEALAEFENTFDVVLAAALLHHLVGSTRRASMDDAMHGLRNAMRMVKPGGTLVVLEPVYQPKAASSALFWMKRATTSLTDQRISVFGYWNNIGAPVVAFYSPSQVHEMVRKVGGEIIASQSTPERVGWGSKLMRKDNLIVIAAKPGP